MTPGKVLPLILLISLASMTGYLGDQTITLQQELTKTNAALSAYETRVTEIKKEANGIKDNLGASQNRVGELQSELSTTKTELNMKLGQVATVEKDLSERKARIQDLQKEVSEKGGRSISYRLG